MTIQITRVFKISVISVFSLGLLLPISSNAPTGTSDWNLDWFIPVADAYMDCNSPSSECTPYDPTQVDSDNDGLYDYEDPCPEDDQNRCDDKNLFAEIWNLALSIWNFLGTVVSGAAAVIDWVSDWVSETGGEMMCVLAPSFPGCEPSDAGEDDEDG